MNDNIKKMLISKKSDVLELSKKNVDFKNEIEEFKIRAIKNGNSLIRKCIKQLIKDYINNPLSVADLNGEKNLTWLKVTVDFSQFDEVEKKSEKLKHDVYLASNCGLTVGFYKNVVGGKTRYIPIIKNVNLTKDGFSIGIGDDNLFVGSNINSIGNLVRMVHDKQPISDFYGNDIIRELKHAYNAVKQNQTKMEEYLNNEMKRNAEIVYGAIYDILADEYYEDPKKLSLWVSFNDNYNLKDANILDNKIFLKSDLDRIFMVKLSDNNCYELRLSDLEELLENDRVFGFDRIYNHLNSISISFSTEKFELFLSYLRQLNDENEKELTLKI